MEKKIIAISILALSIGIVTVLPIAVFTPRTVAAQINPWFDVDMLYANVIPNPFGGSGDLVNVFANFTFTPDAVDLRGADAKIEVFNFHVYSDKTSIANITYCLSLSGNVPDPNSPYGATTAIMEWGDGFWTFADGTKYNVKDIIGYAEGSGASGLAYCGIDPIANLEENHLAKNPIIQAGHLVGHGNALLSEVQGEKFAQALANLRNAPTLYIDVTRVMTVTYHHQVDADSTTSSITTTLANSEVLGHIELAKTDFGFASGSVPDFMLNNALHTNVLPPGTPTSPPPVTSQPPLKIDMDWADQ
ncbi:MAG: hypothetical protein FWG55_00805 [Candidatus Bathyarchaeota archaeon]|nr:hypothetical protein [Candidatus Termiticorpusculum sp.]